MVGGLEGCEAYTDAVIVYSDAWQQHTSHLQALLSRFLVVNLTNNLTKSEFDHAEVIFLGHIVGNCQVKPAFAKT